MITYAKLKNGEVETYPYGLGRLRSENPYVSFSNGALSNSEIRDQFDVVEVAHVDAPTKAGWKANQVGPVKENGAWTQKWEEVAKTENELSASDITNPDPPSGAALEDEHGVEVRTHVDNGPVWKGDHWEVDWQMEDLPYRVKRLNAYGKPYQQIEHITENGLESWKAHVETIKARYPKT